MPNTIEHATCNHPGCEENDPTNFNRIGKKYDEDGILRVRAKCVLHDARSRLNTKKKKLKGSKNLISTNGGSSRSRQKVRK